jgi:hypothetical protein
MSHMAEHRVPMLSASLRRYPDPELSADPRIFAVVSALRTLELAPAPRPHFRAELRTQLVAVAPRLVAEGTAVEGPLATADAGRHAVRSARPASGPALPATSLNAPRPGRFGAVLDLSLGRPLAIVTAMVAVFALVLGAAVWMSNKALPGDPLYSLKRANENVKLSLAGGPTAKSKAYLDFAAERADEVAALLKRSSASALGAGATASSAVSPHTASLVRSTLDSADSDVTDAAVLLGNQAVSNQSADPLKLMLSWAPGQIARLQTITDRLPAGVLHDRAAGSADLVRSALVRADNLSAMASCSCLATATSDALGPVPCSPCTAPVTPGAAIGPGNNPASAATTTPAPPTSASTGTGSGSTSSSGTDSSSPGSTDSSGGVSVPTLPTLPIQLPTLPTLHFPSHTPGKTPSVAPVCVVTLLGICVHL